MTHDLAQFREKLVRLRNQTDQALYYIDSEQPFFDSPVLSHDPQKTGFSVGDFTVLDRFQTFTKEPQ